MARHDEAEKIMLMTVYININDVRYALGNTVGSLRMVSFCRVERIVKVIT